MKFLEKWKGYIFKFFALVLGLFGVSTLLSAKKSKEVKEAKKDIKKTKKKVVKSKKTEIDETDERMISRFWYSGNGKKTRAKLWRIDENICEEG